MRKINVKQALDLFEALSGDGASTEAIRTAAEAIDGELEDLHAEAMRLDGHASSVLDLGADERLGVNYDISSGNPPAIAISFSDNLFGCWGAPCWTEYLHD